MKKENISEYDSKQVIRIRTNNLETIKLVEKLNKGFKEGSKSILNGCNELRKILDELDKLNEEPIK